MKRSLLLCATLLLLTGITARGQESVSLQGTVKDAVSGESMPGVVLRIKDTRRGTVSDEKGNFSLSAAPGTHTLDISFIGYTPLAEPFTFPGTGLEIRLSPSELSLEGVEVVSTGYQTLTKERATGSFVKLDRELVGRRVSTNLLDRLEDVTSGLIFNKGGTSEGDPISIRGRSTPERPKQ